MGTAKRRMAQACRVEVTVDAPLNRCGRSSPTSHGRVSGATSATTSYGSVGHRGRAGVRFRGRNRSGWLRWSRTCEVLAVDTLRQIAWRTIPTPLMVDSSDWRISLEPAGTGTQIVQTFQMTKFPRWWEWTLVRMNPSHIDRSTALTEDLRRIG